MADQKISEFTPTSTLAAGDIIPLVRAGNDLIIDYADWPTPPSSTEGIWNFSTSTTMADPSNGNMRANNAAFGSATALAISYLTLNNVERSQVLKSLQIDDQLVIQDKTNSANWIRYKVTATPTDNTTWFQIAVASISGSGSNPGNNDDLIISFGSGGGIVSPSQGGLPTGGTATQVLSKNSATNYDASWATLSGATYQTPTTSALSPTGTTSTSGVMMGMGSTFTITPVRSGKVLLMITGTMQNATAPNATSVLMRYGTGTAPANAAAGTGTNAGSQLTGFSASANAKLPFTCEALVTGLTLNQAIWFDLLTNAVGGGTAILTGVTAIAYELP